MLSSRKPLNGLRAKRVSISSSVNRPRTCALASMRSWPVLPGAVAGGTPYHSSRLNSIGRWHFCSWGILPHAPWDLTPSGRLVAPEWPCHSGESAQGSALGSHPCVALSSARAIASVAEFRLPRQLDSAFPGHTRFRYGAWRRALTVSGRPHPLSRGRGSGPLHVSWHSAGCSWDRAAR